MKNFNCNQIVSKSDKLILIHEPVYCQNYCFVCTAKYKDFEKMLVDQLKLKLDNPCDGQDEKTMLGEFSVYGKGKDELCLIWIANKRIETLVHECVHAANYVLQTRGIMPDKENDEPLAYLVEFLVSYIRANW